MGIILDSMKDSLIPYISIKSTKEMYNALVLDSGKPCELWHMHFGHLHHGALRLLKNMVQGLPDFKVEYIKEMKGLLNFKHSRAAFPSNDQKLRKVLKLIHSR
jgi:hypothetical protein